VELRPEAVACLAAAARFQTVRDGFPVAFWRSAAADFATNLPIFAAFVPNVPADVSEMVQALCDLSAEHNTALSLLVTVTQRPDCAKVVVTRLPVQNQSSPTLLLRLYRNLSLIDGAHLILGEEMEFYTICRLLISTDQQHNACKLIRKVAINPVLLESSGLIEQIALLITTSSDPRCLLDLLSVVFSLSRERFFRVFGYLVPKLTEFAGGSVLQLRVGSFLCLTQFVEYCDDVNVDALVLSSAEFVNSGNSAVATVCCDFLKKVADQLRPECLKNAVRIFLATGLQENPKAAEFARILLDSADTGIFDENERDSLHSIADPQS
jgi:hypothetical protein